MIEVARYRLPLARPMRFAGRTLTEREGFFLRTEGAIGEVAPLPGAHRETAEECLAVLRRHAAGESVALPTGLAFGLSVATAIARQEPLVARPLANRCAVNALFAGSPAEADAALARGAFDGFAAVKVKVGSDPLGDRGVVERLLAGLPPATALRLDANRQLDLASAKELLRGLDIGRIEYIEEPLADPLQLPALHFATGVGLALDESLLDPFLRSALETAPGVVAHVLKPSLHGSLAAARARAERSARQGIRTTLSNALETSYTLRVLARFATWLANPSPCHGLATGGMLLGDPTPPSSIVGGCLATDDPLPAPAIAFVPLAYA